LPNTDEIPQYFVLGGEPAVVDAVFFRVPPIASDRWSGFDKLFDADDPERFVPAPSKLRLSQAV
jgi:hypothetical protein